MLNLWVLGFETVTYVLRGAVEHEDFCGHKGRIESGDLQWMTAGRGIVHSEMPGTDDETHLLQLWVNLKSEDKLCEPNYQELLSSQIPSGCSLFLFHLTDLFIQHFRFTKRS